MADLSTTQVSGTTTNVGLAAASAGGDTIASQSGVWLLVHNGGGSSITVSLAVQTSTDIPGYTRDATEDYTVAAGDLAAIPAWNPAFKKDDGRVDVTYSGVTSVEVAAVEF